MVVVAAVVAAVAAASALSRVNDDQRLACGWTKPRVH